VLKALDPATLAGAVCYDPLLREFNRGFFGQDLAAVRGFQAERPRHGAVQYRFPGYDSVLDVHQRAAAFVASLRAFLGEGFLGDADTVVIVGHNCAMVQLLARLLAKTAAGADAAISLPNCCVAALDRFAVDAGAGGCHADTYAYAPSASLHAMLGTFGEGAGAATQARAAAYARRLAADLNPGGLVFAGHA